MYIFIFLIVTFYWTITQTNHHTLSGSTGSALAWHTMVQRSRPSGGSNPCDLWQAFASFSTWRSRGTALCKVEGYGQSIGSSVSDAIAHSWLWSTAPGSWPLGCFSSITSSCYWEAPGHKKLYIYFILYHALYHQLCLDDINNKDSSLLFIRSDYNDYKLSIQIKVLRTSTNQTCTVILLLHIYTFIIYLIEFSRAVRAR